MLGEERRGACYPTVPSFGVARWKALWGRLQNNMEELNTAELNTHGTSSLTSGRHGYGDGADAVLPQRRSSGSSAVPSGAQKTAVPAYDRHQAKMGLVFCELR